MRINSSGRVGIKTTTPATELDISTGATTGGVKRYITLTSLNGSSAEIGYADIGVTFNQNTASNESGGMNFRIMHDGTMRDRYLFGAGAGDVHAWYTGADIERMRINSSGGVNIGNTGDAGATNLSVTGKVTAGASGVSAGIRNLFTSTDRISVASATTIFDPALLGANVGASAAILLVNGFLIATPANSFADLVLFVAGTTPVVVSSKNRGSPAARTYTNLGSALQLAMASGTYNVASSSVEQAC